MYTKEELHKIIKEVYEEKQNTITLEDVGKKIGKCGETVRYYLKNVNGYENCPDVFRNILKPLHNFDNVDKESAYWLGYLMADGCYTSNSSNKPGYRLMLECKVDDKEILEKFCEFLEIRKNRITFGHKGASVALNIADNAFTTSVSKYGIVKNKSHTENHLPTFAKNNEELFFQYFRGLIDGDGTICTGYSSKGIELFSNSIMFVSEIKEELIKYIPEPTSIWIMEKTIEKQKGKNATQSLFIIKIGTGVHERSNMKYIYNKFYNGQKIILSRKEKLFKTIL